MTTKLATKLFRMKMLTDVRDFIESIPVQDLVEKQTDDCIYAGDGVISTGINYFETTVKIIRDSTGDVFVSIRSPKAGINTELPFCSKVEKEQAPKLVNDLLYKYMN